MLNITFLNAPDTVYTGSFSRVGDNLVSITNVPAVEGGFVVSRLGKNDKWNYADYSTIYKSDDNITIFSNNGAVYVAPTVEIGGTISWDDNEDEDNIRPTEVVVTLSNGETYTTNEGDAWSYTFGTKEADLNLSIAVDGIEDYEVEINGYDIVYTHVPLSAIKAQKVEALNASQQAIIKYGTDIQLSDGTVEHFTLSDQDQISLEGLATLVASGSEYIPWHTSNHEESCKYYSNTDMAIIIQGAMSYVTYHVTYFRDLRIYVNSLETKEEVEMIEYGIQLPEAYQSIVLKDILSQM